jgi:signal transduction histidine kinase
MPPDHPPDLDAAPADAPAVLRHDLKGALTAIRGQAQLVARRLRRPDGLDADERAALLARLERIDASVVALAARIDRLGDGADDR